MTRDFTKAERRLLEKVMITAHKISSQSDRYLVFGPHPDAWPDLYDSALKVEKLATALAAQSKRLKSLITTEGTK